MNTIVWFRIWFITVTPYGVLIALALAAMYLITMRIRPRFRALSQFSVAGCMLLCVPCAVICSRLFHWVFAFGKFGHYSFWQALALWRGGYSMCGAFLGFALGARLYCRPRRINFMDALDCFSPALALFVFIERLAEHFTDQGVGKEIDTEFLRGGLFSMTDMYGAARHAVYRMEAVSALIALIAVLLFFRACDRRRFRLRGEAFRLTLLLLAAPQVVWESLRDDGYLAYGYVRVSQIACMLCVLGLGFYYLVKWMNTGMPMGPIAIQTAVLLLFCGLTVRQEFAVDSSQNMEMNYLIMAVAMLAMSLAVMKARKSWSDWVYRRARRSRPART